jgi:isoleucyl-tRNA synthetase
MKQYHLSRTVGPLISFLDDLTNWYIRRSRRRFWKSENDSDKFQAYSTLYTVILDFCKLAAPFIPFITETIYQKLKLGHESTEHDSLHLCPYPETVEISAAQLQLAEQMDLARDIVALGRELREKQKLRIRQPLAKLFVGIAGPSAKEQLNPMLGIIKEELNVKEVEFGAAGNMAQWKLKPNFKLVGKKLGSKMPAFQKFCSQVKEHDIHTLLDGKAITVDGDSYFQESFLINLEPNPNFEHPCHASSGIIVAFDTELTDSLKQEGYARELINRVQRFRKEIGLNVEDRINLAANVSAAGKDAFNAFKEMIEAETLSTLTLEEPESSMSINEEKIEDFCVKIGISKRTDRP